MKNNFLSVLSLLVVSLLVLVQDPATASGQSADPTMKREAETKARKEMTPKSDDEIQKCIVGKLARSEKLKSQGFTVTVSNGEAMLGGNAQNAGSKGATTRIAQSCGARSVKNNITAPAIPRPKKAEPEKKS
jgi:osmotically-inducible protein OsmY